MAQRLPDPSLNLKVSISIENQNQLEIEKKSNERWLSAQQIRTIFELSQSLSNVYQKEYKSKK